MFNSFYVREKDTGKEYDVYDDGVWSGAFYVSSLLVLSSLLDKPHSTTATIKSVFDNKKEKDWGWEEVDTGFLKPGDVIFWEEIEFEDGTKSDQVGFYIDAEEAYSTSSTKRTVVKHHPTFGTDDKGNPVRKIVTAYRNSFKN